MRRVTRTKSFLFFFQAEDGIRDLTVTGVQTLLFRSIDRGNHKKVLAVVSRASYPNCRRHPGTVGNIKQASEQAQGQRRKYVRHSFQLVPAEMRSKRTRPPSGSTSSWYVYPDVVPVKKMS